MWTTRDSDRGYGFIAPLDATTTEGEEVLFPLCKVQTPAYAAVIAVAISQMDNIVTVDDLTGSPTINLAIHSQVTKGANLMLELTGDGAARTATLGTGFDGGTIVAPDGETVRAMFKYDGVNFRMIACSNDTVQDGAVTAEKLAADAVETAKIKDAAVTLAKLADGTAAGDLMWFNGTDWVLLPKGTDGQVLKMVSGSPAWATDAVS
jgi:hypothetical protein